MTARQRRHLRSGLMLGVTLTILVVAMGATGWLGGFENWIYRERARRCQVFTPRPTTQLVHLDIDDEALAEFGRWPWPRAKMAEMIDELRELGARVIVLDILLSEPQQKRAGEVDEDEALAGAIRRHRAVVVPVSLTIGRQERPSELMTALVDVFEHDLETPLADARRAVSERFAEVSVDTLVAARRQALRRRVAREMANGIVPTDKLIERLLPRTWGTPGAATLEQNVTTAAMEEESRRLIASLTRTAETPPANMLRAVGDIVPTPTLARAAAYTGFVDHLPFDDGVVRAVPLWMEDRGMLVPFMGLSMACAALEVPLADVRIEPGRVVIPLKDGNRIELPVMTYDSAKLGERVGLMMNVPWWGTRTWETMYDWPRHRAPLQHIPVGIVMQAARAREQIVRNNLAADEALEALGVQALGMDEARTFLKNPPPPDGAVSRFEIIRAVLKEADKAPYVEPLKTKPRDQMDPDERGLIDAYTALEVVLRGNQKILDDESGLRRQLEGKTVLVGSIASGAADFVSTPLHAQCPGAVVHGAVFNAIMTGSAWRVAPGWVNAATTVAVGLLITLLVVWMSPLGAVLATAATIAGYLGINGYVIFDWGDYLLGAAGPVTAAALVWGVVTVTRYVVERAERQRITARFRSYADEQLVDYVLDTGRDIFEGEEQELTVVFTDMKGFTSLMERLGKRIVPLLNDYMGRMVPIIQAHGGYVNKFLGDGIMFFYGAPRPNHDHAADAVQTVLEMQRAVAEFNRLLEEQGLDSVAVRAGVTTGFMIVGDAGPKKRSDYTVLGDSVNLASRLEGANKYFGTSVMISERTGNLLDGRFLLRPVGRVRVVGKTAWVMAYEPLAPLGRETPEQRELAHVTARIVDAFVDGRFEPCIKAAEEGIERFGAHRLFEVYRDLAARHAREAADAFDGVVELAEK